MPRILIVDCCDTASQTALARLGARLNVPLFEEALRLHDPAVQCVSVNLADQEMPDGVSLGDFDGVMLTGSPLCVCDPLPEVRRQIDFARAVFATGLPVWGSCYGLQLATVALGGVVRRNPNGREIGVARGIALSDAGLAHPLLAGRPAVFDALCSHLDEVETLPPGAMVLAGNAVSAVQAMAVRTPAGGTFFGTQYHPELDLPVLAALLRLRPAALLAEAFARSEAELSGMAADWFALAAAPERRDLAWRYGIGPEILDPHRRTLEIGNWLRSIVRMRLAA